MKNKTILSELEKRLENEYLKSEHKHITFLRKKVLEEAKKENLIKDYKLTTYCDYKKIYWGSMAGYDQMYLIIL